MFTVRLSPKLEARLNQLAKWTGRSKAYYAKQAIAEFLDGQEDSRIAIAHFEDKLPSVPIRKVVNRLV